MSWTQIAVLAVMVILAVAALLGPDDDDKEG